MVPWFGHHHSQCYQGLCQVQDMTFVHSLFELIIHHHPFELLVGDYLSLPTGRGSFKTLGVFLDVYL